MTNLSDLIAPGKFFDEMTDLEKLLTELATIQEYAATMTALLAEHHHDLAACIGRWLVPARGIGFFVGELADEMHGTLTARTKTATT